MTTPSASFPSASAVPVTPACRSSRRLRRQLSFTPPAERLVLLYAWDNGVERHVDRRPVVALCTCEELTYERTFADGGNDARPAYSSEDALLDAHYELRESRLVVWPVVVDPSIGLTVWDEDDELVFDHVATAVVACSWPPIEDDTRLRDDEAQVLEEATQRARLAWGVNDGADHAGL